MTHHDASVNTRPLSAVCCQRDADPHNQRRQILDVLAAGADIAETDKNGVTPLHHAVRFRSSAAVATLIEQGAHVDQACKRSGSTPLHRAVTSTGAPARAGKSDVQLEIIRLLIDAGADPTIENKRGLNPRNYVKPDTAAAAILDKPTH